MRLFLAIDLPSEIKEYTHSFQSKLGDSWGKVKWVEKENIHITLKFLGDVAEKKISKIKELIRSIKVTPFKLVLSKIGVFPSSQYVKVIWIGFENEEKLFELHKLVDIKLSKMFTMERDFLGHVTLGRVRFVKDKNMLRERIEGIVVDKKEFLINGFKLYKSELTEQGPVYEVVEEYGLKFYYPETTSDPETSSVL